MKQSSPPPDWLDKPSGEKLHWELGPPVQLPCIHYLSGGLEPNCTVWGSRHRWWQGCFRVEITSDHSLHRGHAVEAVALHSLAVKHRAACQRMLLPVRLTLPRDSKFLPSFQENRQELFSRPLYFGQLFAIITRLHLLSLDLGPLDLEPCPRGLEQLQWKP